ncbi:hypothetical protein PT974_04815 [Cladobotryum mycophilum]|uniref:N-acetyltransferase domain-containing protein n=1 Tax=Cladobotryum mycophilum TaxID=491253 RepID=A0ABR0SRJ9_9HYPO
MAAAKAAVLNIIVSVADLDKDWDELFASFWNSWESPFQAALILTLPGIEARATDQVWLKAEDPIRKSRGLSPIIGGISYTYIRDKSALGQRNIDHQLPVSGFDPGSEQQELSRAFHSQLWDWHTQLMQGDHIYVGALWVRPECRRSGAAHLILNQLYAAADQLGTDIYAEVTIMSTPLFLKRGFRVISYPTMVFHKDEPSVNWLHLTHQLQSQPVSIVWRAKGGVHREGETALPWEKEPEVGERLKEIAI